MGADMRNSLIACSFGLALTTSAQAADVDWKMYGAASIPDRVVCFYESKGLVAQPTLRVWTKCLLQKDLDSVDFDSELGKKIIENAVRKMTDIYVPPIALVEDINFDQAMEVAGCEETANLSNIQPQASIFYELNCSERMMRQLSTHVLVKGKGRSDDKPKSWEYVPPEGNGARLLKILCR
jgi:hypothetical protein